MLRVWGYWSLQLRLSRLWRWYSLEKRLRLSSYKRCALQGEENSLSLTPVQHFSHLIMITQRGGRGLYKSARRALTSQIWLDGRPFENSFYTVWNFRKKELAISLLHDMATKTKPVSLVQQFDELMACADILCVGNENSKLLSTRVVPKILFIFSLTISLSLSLSLSLSSVYRVCRSPNDYAY